MPRSIGSATASQQAGQGQPQQGQRRGFGNDVQIRAGEFTVAGQVAATGQRAVDLQRIEVQVRVTAEVELPKTCRVQFEELVVPLVKIERRGE